MSYPKSLAINPLCPSRLPQPNIVQDLIMMNVLNEVALERKTGFSNLGIISLDEVRSERTSQKEIIPTS